MSQARRIGVGILGVAGVGAVIVAGLTFLDRRDGAPPPPVHDPAPTTTHSEPADVVEGLRSGHPEALTTIAERLAPPQQDATTTPPAPSPLSVEQADEFLGWVDALRAGFSTYGGPSKLVALTSTGLILDRFTIDGTPTGWARILDPSFEVLAAGLSDRDPAVRVAAADLVGQLWDWAPGCTMTPAEENDVAAWKEGFHPLAVRRLQDGEPLSRAAAVRCLGQLPIDAMAEPAVAAIGDSDFNVRYQTLVAFANRPSLLTEDQILPMLHDPIPDLGSLAERVLKARGLPQELVGLGRLIAHARPDIRSSAIPLLLKRDDIDPVVWLLRLTEDPDASVRLQAVQALEGRSTAEVDQRLRELATSDESEEVRATAARIAPPAAGRTASLPPLPPTPGMGLRAN